MENREACESNAIVVVKDGATLGVRAGHMNRVGSAKIALEQAATALAEVGKDIKAIVQPGGSVRDEDSVKKANECGITMLCTGMRHFKH